MAVYTMRSRVSCGMASNLLNVQSSRKADLAARDSPYETPTRGTPCANPVTTGRTVRPALPAGNERHAVSLTTHHQPGTRDVRPRRARRRSGFTNSNTDAGAVLIADTTDAANAGSA